MAMDSLPPHVVRALLLRVLCGHHQAPSRSEGGFRLTPLEIWGCQWLMKHKVEDIGYLKQ